MYVRTLSVILWFALGTTASIRTQLPQVTQTALAGAQQADMDATAPAELPFKIHNTFLIVVEGRIGTVSKLHFIMDTGATRTIVDKRVARKLGIHGLPSTLLTMRQASEVEVAIVSNVHIGPVQGTNIPLLIADLASFTEYAEGVDGILGLDLLWGRRISIDFTHKRLIISPALTESTQSLSQGELVCITTTAQIEGYPVRLLVDTGFDGILLYHDRVPQLEIDNLKVIELGHSLFVNEVMVQNIRVGTADIRNSKVLLFPNAPAGFSAKLDGVLGTASLKAKWLLIDFTHGNFAWKQ